MEFQKFVKKAPHHQNAIDIFKGRWACSIPYIANSLQAGTQPLFTADRRPFITAQVFGDVLERLDGFDVLELGPLEGGHTYQLEKLGGNVTAIEGNTEAFLKCLIVKEVLQLKARFYLGDFTAYLSASKKKYDLVFASGVLYHMTDPANLIRLITEHTSRCFVWTHYWIPDNKRTGRVERNVEIGGELSLTYYTLSYGESENHGRFWGGLENYASWMTIEDIQKTFSFFGFTQFKILEDKPDHMNGPAVSFAAWR